MKIGVLTLPLHNNYGGLMQAYAMMELLKTRGYDASFIYLEPINVRLGFKIKEYIKFLIKRYVLWQKNAPYYGLNIDKSSLEFIDKLITPKSEKIRDCAQLRRECDKFDLIILGSDQVFRPLYFSQFSECFGLGNSRDKLIKISYAASFGGSKFECKAEKKELYKRAFHKFRAISVRESSGVDICKDEFDLEAAFVLDPTLVLGREAFEEICALIPRQEGELLNYVLDVSQKKHEFVAEVAENMGLKIRLLRGESHVDHPSPQEWIAAFRDAKVVITDSFHGMVFSLLFHKPFLAVCNFARGSDRFASLLEILGLSKRLIDPATLHITPVFEPIDWDDVDKKLLVWRQKSLEFLEKNLYI